MFIMYMDFGTTQVPPTTFPFADTDEARPVTSDLLSAWCLALGSGTCFSILIYLVSFPDEMSKPMCDVLPPGPFRKQTFGHETRFIGDLA
jgi:hypothetical protein